MALEVLSAQQALTKVERKQTHCQNIGPVPKELKSVSKTFSLMLQARNPGTCEHAWAF